MSATASSVVPQARERYRALFHAQQLPTDALTAWRTAALDHFLENGFPTQRDEGWKYTNLRRLEARSFGPADSAQAEQAIANREESQWLTVAGMRTVLLNGRWAPQLSSTLPQPPGVTVLTLGQWLHHAPEQAAEFLQRHAPRSAAFEHLNHAFVSDGGQHRMRSAVVPGPSLECARADEPPAHHRTGWAQ
jgi:Fe-S cluster assembly protein SufD